MFDNTLLQVLDKLVQKEKLANEFKNRLRIKGTLIAKKETKKGNLKITVAKRGNNYNFLIPKTHKERYALAKSLAINSLVSVEGTRRKLMLICTKLKVLENIDDSKQSYLKNFK